MGKQPVGSMRESPAAPFASQPSGQGTVVSAKGQVVLPKPLRDALGWAPGTRLVVEQTPEGLLLRRPGVSPVKSIDQVYGMLKQYALDSPPSKQAEREAMGKMLAEDDERIQREFR
jgi:AbrB family looped-hinge helix DNA binding protein